MLPEQTNRRYPDMAPWLSTAGDAFGTQLCVMHDGPDDSRLDALG
ncbi:hypothetical protein AB0B25_08295 [Nocardia sp. NPDC049190]